MTESVGQVGLGLFGLSYQLIEFLLHAVDYFCWLITKKGRPTTFPFPFFTHARGLTQMTDYD